MSDYTPSGVPATSATLSSSAVRAELVLVQTAVNSKANSASATLTSPTLVTPALGVATATSINGAKISTGTAADANSVAIGTGALDSVTTGNYNIAIGLNALTANADAIGNTSLGNITLVSNVSGNYNTAVGQNALNATTGTGNTAVGVTALGYNTTGTYNTAIGYQTTSNNTTGSNNSFIGNEATGAAAGTSNAVTLGNSSITVLRCQVTSITALSDARDKETVLPLSAGLDFINLLKPVSFVWNMRDGGKTGVLDTGFIAQDLQQVQLDTGIAIPQLVYDENPEKLEAAYGKLIPVIVKALQELSAEVKSLKAQS